MINSYIVLAHMTDNGVMIYLELKFQGSFKRTGPVPVVMAVCFLKYMTHTAYVKVPMNTPYIMERKGKP